MYKVNKITEKGGESYEVLRCGLNCDNATVGENIGSAEEAEKLLEKCQTVEGIQPPYVWGKHDTLDELIGRLQKVREVVGGDTPVAVQYENEFGLFHGHTKGTVDVSVGENGMLILG